MIRVAFVLGLLALGCGCAPGTRHIPAVEGFVLDRYLGKWYEIARLPHSFEEGLSHVTAEYSRRPDGTIQVVNRGYDAEAGRWRSATGRARPASDEGRGELRVTFFWPFWGAYRIIALDEEGYRYAMVTSSRMSYLWILSRSPTLPKETLCLRLAKARQYGFNLSRLILVDQSPGPPPLTPPPS